MMRYLLSSAAQTDLINIGQYTVQKWDGNQAKKYLAEIRQVLLMLCEMPKVGKHRPDVKEGVYSFTHESHTIYYMLTSSELIVIGILHKSSVPLNHLEL